MHSKIAGIAMKYRKIKFGDRMVFLPTGMIRGDYYSDENILINEQNQVFSSINSDLDIKVTEQNKFYKFISNDELKNIFTDTPFNIAIESYFNGFKNTIIVANKNKDGSNKITEIDLDTSLVKSDSKGLLLQNPSNEKDTDLEIIPKLPSKKEDVTDIFKNVKEINEYVKGIIIGQDEHVDRITTEILKMMIDEKNKSPLLVTGSTGVGKTKILSLIAEKLNRAFLIVDTTQLSIAGYVGKNIEDYLYDLYIREDRNISRVENAIIVFDEIDKKGSSKNDDVSGKGVLNSLLKFIDGTYYTFKDGNKQSSPTITIDTSNMLIVGAGSFASVYKNEKFTKNALGFGNGIEEKKEVTTEDFIELGMLPDEFMGRFSTIIRLNDLDVKDLENILLYSKDSPIIKEVELFKKIGVKLCVTDEYIKNAASKAYDLNTGARSLKNIIKESSWRAFKYAMENYPEYNAIDLTGETVNDNSIYMIGNIEDEKTDDIKEYKKIRD